MSDIAGPNDERRTKEYWRARLDAVGFVEAIKEVKEKSGAFHWQPPYGQAWVSFQEALKDYEAHELLARWEREEARAVQMAKDSRQMAKAAGYSATAACAAAIAATVATGIAAFGIFSGH